MSDVRIISFLPAATEMACALGMEEQLVGVSHECDFPASVRNKEVVVRCSVPTETMTPAEIDVAVAERVRSGQSLYEVDQAAVERLAPTHILTQALCVVCAPSSGEVARALKFLPSELNAATKDKERFLQEARTASALDHANIGVIHGLEETADGRTVQAVPWFGSPDLRGLGQANALMVLPAGATRMARGDKCATLALD